MSFLPWSERYAVGHEGIDWDHRTLFQMVNDVHDGLESVELDPVWDMLEIYTDEHFGREEQWMAETQFPGAADHKKEHRLLIDQLRRHRAGFADGSISRPQILHFLKLWLIGHITGTDTKLAGHLNATAAAPLSDGPVTQLPAAPSAADLARIEWGKLSAVVVDDHMNIRHIVKAILRSMGITDVMEAADGLEALKVMEAVGRAYDIVIADEDPEQQMSGIELCRQLRTKSDSPCPEAVVLIAPAAADLNTVKAALAAGAHDVIAKPFSTNAVRQRLERYLAAPLPFANVNGVRTPVRPALNLVNI